MGWEGLLAGRSVGVGVQGGNTTVDECLSTFFS